MTNYLEEQLANHVLRNIAFASPAAVYVALFTSDPTDAVGTGEVSGGGYTRKQATFGAPSNGAVSNTADIYFPVATADWGTITHFVLYDADLGGNPLVHGAFDVAKPIYTGDQFIIRAGDLTVTFD